MLGVWHFVIQLIVKGRCRLDNVAIELFCFALSVRSPTLVAEAGAQFVYFLHKLGEILKFDMNFKIFYLYLYSEIFAPKFDTSIADVTSYANCTI